MEAEGSSFEDLGSVRTDTYHAYRAANELLKALNVLLAVFWECIE